MHRRLQIAGAVALTLLLAERGEAKVASHWKPLPPLPTPRQEVGVAGDDTHVYVIGGILAGGSATGVVDRLDVANEMWEPVPALPDDVRVHHVGAASAEGTIFAIGGLNAAFRGVKTVFAYNPNSNAWTRKADLPRVRGAMGVAAIDDKIYAAGGQDGGASVADFTVYLVHEDRWETLPAMPTARNHLAAASAEGIFYAVGGRDGRLFGKLEAFNPQTSRWLELAPMPTARGGIAAAVARDCIFVFGGEGNGEDPNGIFPQVEGYDLCRNEWASDELMPNPRHGIGAATVGESLYIPGGSPTEGFGVTEVADAYYPGSGGRFGFLRGDSNLDQGIDLSDSVHTLSALFLGGVRFGCEDAADTNDTGQIDISDAIFGLVYLFLGGQTPPAPGPDLPGLDPTEDALSCQNFLPPRCVEPF